MTRADDVSQVRPVQFRVKRVGANPRPHQLSPNELVVTIERIGASEIELGISSAQFEPYRAAVIAAIESGAVYWVDWDYPKPTAAPHHEDETMLDRLLNAIKNGQRVEGDDE
jgi:hypothetical protein